MRKRVPFAVLLANGDNDAAASLGDGPAAIPVSFFVVLHILTIYIF
jgi:hypothetical protein